MFQVTSDFQPTGDQPKAIEQLVYGVKRGLKNQVLLGVTGSGKTYTMAKVIEKLQMPALIISHNKTLAGQLYQEFRDFFPHNAVSYFVSYYDYYQPEAYIPATDTYIEKEAQINELIDKLRLQSTTNILTRPDTIVVASVSCIYNIGDPSQYGQYVIELATNQEISEENLLKRLILLQYQRNEFDFKRGSLRRRGDFLDIFLSYEDFGYRIEIRDNKIISLSQIDPLTGKITRENLKNIVIYPAKHFLTSREIFDPVEKQIRQDLAQEVKELKRKGKIIEAERLLRRVNYDLEMIREVGYVNGIENYSRYFDGRAPGEPPYTLINYFQKAYGKRWLLFIDESHMTVPQLQGMFRGDYSRKKTLVEYGFRLKAAFDNRPLKFEEFYQLPSYIIYVSATPDDWELEQAKKEAKNLKLDYQGVAQQLIRPTGIVDPEIEIRPAKNEVEDLVSEIEKEVTKKNKILVTTLTKRIAEDLTDFLKDKGIRAMYLHSDIETLKRSNILENLRRGEYDVLIGINLLREGLDLPEVGMVAILDGDREGFLRSKTSLIQTMGRAARNVHGRVIIYADIMTRSIEEAKKEIERRRRYQLEYNRRHQINPQTVYKPIREKIIDGEVNQEETFLQLRDRQIFEKIDEIKTEGLTPYDQKRFIKKLERLMKKAADDLNFELAIKIRDKIKSLSNEGLSLSTK